MSSNYRFPAAEDGIEPWLHLSNAAKLLKTAPRTLRFAAEAGEIAVSIRYWAARASSPAAS
ncbi:hypothetical protein IVA95_27975 [Bradyrhizobium sp. 157]|uniref:hypothetical protein n=1 Tax=Bradyrhizobium sp. 157 TaxID=2782631 RepID=UPI001FF8C3A0|nr:hypothetical protein [Bradyrhizobium sp. 157]MCK1641313.1 hypothetical protein [Bradyrhizobium sp. 157]